MRSPLYRAVTVVGGLALFVAAIAATKPPAVVGGQPTLDRVAITEATFPYPHLVITRSGSQAVLTFDDGTVAPGRSVIYQVPTDGTPAGVPNCDTAELICWGTTTVDPALNVRVQLDYLGTPCVVVGSPTTTTRVQCTESG